MPNSHTYQFFSHSHEAWDAIYKACVIAKTSILFEHFIFIDDESGRPLIDLFKRKVKEGVRVRMILDALGSTQAFPFPLEAELREAGVEIVFFNTLIPGTLHYLNFWFFRDHRKLVIIDSQIAFTGGVCFQEQMKEWRDTCVQIEGPVVQDMTKSFAIMWQRANKKQRSSQKSKHLDADNPFIFLTNEPFIRRRFLYRELLERIKKAKRYIRLTTPYFVPDGKLAHALRRAARRGVEVSLLIPNHSDKRLVDLAAQGYFSGLLRSGVNIYWGGERFNHTKAGTIDGEWGTLGSLNLDSASLWYNFEGNLVTNDLGFITALDEQFIDDCRSAERVDVVRWHNRSWYLKFLEFCVRPLRFVL